MTKEFLEKVIIALITAITTGVVTFIVTYYFNKKSSKEFYEHQKYELVSELILCSNVNKNNISYFLEQLSKVPIIFSNYKSIIKKYDELYALFHEDDLEGCNNGYKTGSEFTSEKTNELVREKKISRAGYVPERDNDHIQQIVEDELIKKINVLLVDLLFELSQNTKALKKVKKIYIKNNVNVSYFWNIVS